MKDHFFPHDYNAQSDSKLQQVLFDLGCEGLGIYWCLIEDLYKDGGSLPLNQIKVIAFALHQDVAKVERVVMDYNLFKNDGVNFWSESANKRMNERKAICEKRRESIMQRWHPDASGNDEIQDTDSEEYECNTNVIQSEYESNSNKEKKRKENINTITSDKSEVFGSVEPASGKSDEIDYVQIVNLYHELCPSFPRIIKISQARKAKIRIRFVDEMKQDWNLLKSIFSAMESSKFLRGNNKTGWKATFDWVFENSKNWVKVAEGNYNDRQTKTSQNNNVNSEWQ